MMSAEGSGRHVVMQITLRKALLGETQDAAIVAVKKELKQLVDLKTWHYLRSASEATSSVHTKTTPCAMFLKDKHDANGKFLMWKARLVDHGHITDPTKYDPFEKQSPTVALEVLFTQLAMAVKEKMQTEGFDVPCAYLNSNLKSGKFHKMKIGKVIAQFLVQVDPKAKEFVQPDGSILVEIRKSLYGLPEAAQLWNEYLTGALINGGYTQCPSEPCLFIRKKGSQVSIVTVYVDDCLHIYKGDQIRAELYASLRNANLHGLKVETLSRGSPISFLGISISKLENGEMFLSQPGYVSNLMDIYKPTRTAPTPCTDEIFSISSLDDPSEEVSVNEFMSKLMRIAYLAARTRPDLTFTVSALATRGKSPTQRDMKKLDRLMEYINGTRDLGLKIKATDMKVSLYCDAGFGIHVDRRSHSGIIAALGSGDSMCLILWKSIRQRLVSTSSTEAELIAIHDGLDFILWIRRVLEFLGYPQECTTVYQDNTSTITIAYMGRGSAHGHTRHIDLRYYFIKQFLDAQTLRLQYLPSGKMIADFLASPRTGQVFRLLRDLIMGR
jgi:hypothetical protein